MMITSRKYTKPALGSVIDFGHPLTKDIKSAFVLNESGGGIAVDLVRNIKLVSSGGAKFGTDGLICSASNGGADMLADNYQKMTGKITCLCAVTEIGTPPNYASFCGTDYGTGSPPYVGYCFDHDGSGRVGCSVNNGSSFQAAGHTLGLTSFKRYSLGFTFVPGTSLKFYINGLLMDSISPGGSDVTYTSGTRFHCGVRSTDAQTLNKIVHYWYTFNRQLSDTEIMEFHINPYKIFNISRLRKTIPNPSGGVVSGQPMMARATTVPYMRQWQPQRVGR